MLEGLLDVDGNGIPDCIEHPFAKGEDLSNQCPYKPGSPEAKVWFTKFTDQYINVEGGYKFLGKPLQPGPHDGDGDLQFLISKLKVCKGMNDTDAVNLITKMQGKLNM